MCYPNRPIIYYILTYFPIFSLYFLYFYPGTSIYQLHYSTNVYFCRVIRMLSNLHIVIHDVGYSVRNFLLCEPFRSRSSHSEHLDLYFENVECCKPWISAARLGSPAGRFVICDYNNVAWRTGRPAQTMNSLELHSLQSITVEFNRIPNMYDP